MNTMDYIILGIVSVWVAWSAYSIWRRRKQCGAGCSNCSLYKECKRDKKDKFTH